MKRRELGYNVRCMKIVQGVWDTDSGRVPGGLLCLNLLSYLLIYSIYTSLYTYTLYWLYLLIC